MIIKITTIILGLVLVVQLGAEAKDWESVDAFKLRPQFVKINQALVEALPEEGDMRKNMDVAGNLLAKKSSSLSGKLGLRKSMVEALELFTSLKTISTGACNDDEPLILLKNWQSIFAPGSSAIRIKSILNEYYNHHVTSCRPLYEKTYHEKVGKVDPKSIARIKNAFEDLELEDFSPFLVDDGKSMGNLLTSPEVNFKPSIASGLVIHIVRKIAKLMDKEESQINWRDNLKSAAKIRSQQTMPGMVLPDKLRYAYHVAKDEEENLHPTMPEDILDKYLLTPCGIYRMYLAGTLDLALIDAQMMSEEELSELALNKEYYDALVYNRLCKSLQKDREEMYEIFAGHWLNHIKFDS